MILVSLIAIAKIQAWRYSYETSIKEQVKISVRVEGFVERPGIYEMVQGALVGDALKKAHPKRFADLRNIDLKAKIAASIDLKIEPLQSIAVHVRGAVKKPQTLELPPGTRLCQIKKIVELTEEGNEQFFKKRQQLSDGEIVEVPKK